MVYSTNATIDAQTARLALNVTTAAKTLQADSVKLNQMIASVKQGAAQFKAQSAQLLKTAPNTTASDLVSWIDQVITWAKNLVSWAHSVDVFGWLNWFINDVNSGITDLQNLANWVNANAGAINEFGTIVSDVESVIGWIIDIAEWV
jgi:hypothetical protein